MNKTLLIIMIMMLAIQGMADDIALKYVTDAELSDYVIPLGVLVFNRDNPEDLRIGDGVTVGGTRVQNSVALTNVAHDFHNDVTLNGNSVVLNDNCSITTDGAVYRLQINTNYVYSLYGAGSDSLGEVVSTRYDTSTDAVVLSVTVSGFDVAPEISYKATATGSWETVTNAVYTWPPETDPFDITLPLPDDTSGYFRVYFDEVLTGKVMTVNATLNAAHIKSSKITLTSSTNAPICVRYGDSEAGIVIPPITNIHPGATAILKSDDGVTSYWQAE